MKYQATFEVLKPGTEDFRSMSGETLSVPCEKPETYTVDYVPNEHAIVNEQVLNDHFRFNHADKHEGHPFVLVSYGPALESITLPKSEYALSSFKPMPFNISFYADDNKTLIGSLTIADKKMVFTGDADASAKIFFEQVCQNYLKYIDSFKV